MSELERREENVAEYRDNYRTLEREGEYEKAGEALWGAISNLVEAIAWARTGNGLGSYTRQKDFVRQLANETSDEELYEAYKDAEDLHIEGFYERLMDRDEFAETATKVEQVVLPRLREQYERVKSSG